MKTYTLYAMCKNCGKRHLYIIPYGVELWACQCLHCGAFRLEYSDDIPPKTEKPHITKIIKTYAQI